MDYVGWDMRGQGNIKAGTLVVSWGSTQPKPLSTLEWLLINLYIYCGLWFE